MALNCSPFHALLGHLYTEVLADKGAITFMQPGGFFSFINDHFTGVHVN